MCLLFNLDEKADENRLYYKIITNDMKPCITENITLPIGHWVYWNSGGVSDECCAGITLGFCCLRRRIDIYGYTDANKHLIDVGNSLLAYCKVKNILIVGITDCRVGCVIAEYIKVVSADRLTNVLNKIRKESVLCALNV